VHVAKCETAHRPDFGATLSDRVSAGKPAKNAFFAPIAVGVSEATPASGEPNWELKNRKD
jgi:hypothetical protein